ncbi:hypothetical protein Scep_028137 [Stephania cephalantha]|uniref:Uncharacterized protein n=1 Tax=Stephania cephalantha TaxID=152367 RepID=A0AAP0HN69_9MAGN
MEKEGRREKERESHRERDVAGEGDRWDRLAEGVVVGSSEAISSKQAATSATTTRAIAGAVIAAAIRHAANEQYEPGLLDGKASSKHERRRCSNLRAAKAAVAKRTSDSAQPVARCGWMGERREQRASSGADGRRDARTTPAMRHDSARTATANERAQQQFAAGSSHRCFIVVHCFVMIAIVEIVIDRVGPMASELRYELLSRTPSISPN